MPVVRGQEGEGEGKGTGKITLSREIQREGEKYCSSLN